MTFFSTGQLARSMTVRIASRHCALSAASVCCCSVSSSVTVRVGVVSFGWLDRSKLGEKLMGAGSPVLLLSGDNADGKVQGIRFANSRPGLGTFGDTNSAERVQVPLVQPWTQDMVEQTKKQRAEREARRRARGN